MELLNFIYVIATAIGIRLVPLFLRIWNWLNIRKLFLKNEELKLGLHFPRRHDLSCYDEKFEFVRSGFCSQQWEISVRQKFCIIWSVVLSYLKSADFTTPGQFEERLNQLTNDDVDVELAKAAILDFNPFFNIHTCYYNETLRKICSNFRNILKERRGKTKTKVPQDLEIISSLLKTNILIVDLVEKQLNVITPGSDSSGNVAHITLFYKEHVTEQNKVQTTLKRFHFGLDDDLCRNLRKNALEIILDTPEMKTVAKEEILPMLERGEKNINFLLTLLKKNMVWPVSQLYDSLYIARKLSDAGFETDPRVLDPQGFSAFYYALQSNDSNLLYILHRYAATSCYESENTFRDPNPGIISNFSKLTEILSADCARSNHFEICGDRAQQARLNYHDLQRLNAFLTQISDGINGIRKRPESNSLEQAAKQKDINLLILDTYASERFFSVGKLDLENYIKHKPYYENLDLTAALLFFDNIFLLKCVLKSPPKSPRLYSELESRFLLSAVTNKCFTKKIINDRIQDLGLESDSIGLPIIPLLERLNLRESIRTFCRILREKTLVEEDIVERIPPREITEMLRNFPELKDEFLIFRLEHYLRTALETESGGLKQKLVIQRALQVIGESINVEKEGPSSIRHLLCKCLPDDIFKFLKKTRNTLSHLESYQFPLKFETEQDDILFSSIQSEIRNIKEAFEEVFEIHRVRFKEFLFNRGLENINQYEGHVRSVENFKAELLREREAQKKKSSELECIVERKTTDGRNVSVSSIEEFCRRLTVKKDRSSEEERIRGEIPPEVKNHTDAIKKLAQDLEEGIEVVPETFDSLFLKKKDLCRIKNEYQKYLEDDAEPSKSSKRKSLLDKIRKAQNPLTILELIFKKQQVSKSQLKFLHEKMRFSDEAKTTLNSLRENSKVPCGDNLANLLNRMKHLRQIAIDEHHDVRYLWETVKSPKAKQFLVYKIVQRYFHDSSFQASLEMLLFDCFAILKNNDERNMDYKNDEEINNEDPFWLKTSYLFNGIDVRNVLAHGDPLLESIGPILDPKDFPSELVKKMLQLFEDRECIQALCDLRVKAELSYKIPENCPECHKLKERIVPCGRWQGYCKLLDPPETCDGIVSFLKKPFETKSKKGNNIRNSKPSIN